LTYSPSNISKISTSEPDIRLAYSKLYNAYGPQGWWPVSAHRESDTAWVEIAVGAILVQHSAWRNVEQAIDQLIQADALSINALDVIEPSRLAELIRSAGSPRVKAKRLKAFARFVVEKYAGSISKLLAGAADRSVAIQRRGELLTIHGVGPETADAILLYAGGAPLFVVDAYARRVMARHGWGDASASYQEVQQFIERSMPRDVELYNENHALLVRVGKEHCKARQPECTGCPLEELLPAGGPITD
jgi:endonuclease-3 related protein